MNLWLRFTFRTLIDTVITPQPPRHRLGGFLGISKLLTINTHKPIYIMQKIKAHFNQIADDLILDSGDVKIQLSSPAGGYVLAVSAERSYWNEDIGDEVIEKVDVDQALDEWATFFHKGNCYQPDGSVAAEIDGEWYTIIYKVEGGYAGIQIA